MEIEQLAGRASRGAGEGAGRRVDRGRRRRRRARSSTAARLRRQRGRPGRRDPQAAVGRVRRRGRDARRGQPAGEDTDRRGARPRRQGDPRRQRRLPAPRPRGAGRQRRRRPARAAGQGEGPQLRQARRRGRHHRQRRRAGHVDAGRRRLRRRGVRRREAGELPRHRRRRERRGDGQRPGDHPRRPGGQSVFVNVFGGITACDEVANGIVQAIEMLKSARRRDRASRWSSGWTATTPRRVGGSSTTPSTTWSSWSTRWTVPRAAWPSSPPRRSKGRDHGDLPHRGQQGHRAGHDRLRGHASTPSACSPPAPRSSAGSTRGRPAKASTSRARRLPVFGSVAEAVKETGADVSVVFVPPAVTKGAVVEAVDAGVPLVVVITEGVPVKDTAEFFAYAQTPAPPGSSARTARA